MTDTTPVDVEPYDLDWLAPDGRIREIVTRYNNPDSPQRKLLATLDLVWDRQRELEAIVRDLEGAVAQIDQPEPDTGECRAWVHWEAFERLQSWVSAHPVSGDQ